MSLSLLHVPLFVGSVAPAPKSKKRGSQALSGSGSHGGQEAQERRGHEDGPSSHAHLAHGLGLVLGHVEDTEDSSGAVVSGHELGHECVGK